MSGEDVVVLRMRDLDASNTSIDDVKGMILNESGLGKDKKDMRIFNKIGWVELSSDALLSKYDDGDLLNLSVVPRGRGGVLFGETMNSRWAEAYGYMAALIQHDLTFCSGIILNDRFVLTNAHCISEFASCNFTCPPEDDPPKKTTKGGTVVERSMTTKCGPPQPPVPFTSPDGPSELSADQAEDYEEALLHYAKWRAFEEARLASPDAPRPESFVENALAFVEEGPCIEGAESTDACLRERLEKQKKIVQEFSFDDEGLEFSFDDKRRLDAIKEKSFERLRKLLAGLGWDGRHHVAAFRAAKISDMRDLRRRFTPQGRNFGMSAANDRLKSASKEVVRIVCEALRERGLKECDVEARRLTSAYKRLVSLTPRAGAPRAEGWGGCPMGQAQLCPRTRYIAGGGQAGVMAFEAGRGFVERRFDPYDGSRGAPASREEIARRYDDVVDQELSGRAVAAQRHGGDLVWANLSRMVGRTCTTPSGLEVAYQALDGAGNSVLRKIEPTYVMVHPTYLGSRDAMGAPRRLERVDDSESGSDLALLFFEEDGFSDRAACRVITGLEENDVDAALAFQLEGALREEALESARALLRDPVPRPERSGSGGGAPADGADLADPVEEAAPRDASDLDDPVEEAAPRDASDLDDPVEEAAPRDASDLDGSNDSDSVDGDEEAASEGTDSDHSEGDHGEDLFGPFSGASEPVDGGADNAGNALVEAALADATRDLQQYITDYLGNVDELLAGYADLKQRASVLTAALKARVLVLLKDGKCEIFPFGDRSPFGDLSEATKELEYLRAKNKKSRVAERRLRDMKRFAHALGVKAWNKVRKAAEQAWDQAIESAHLRRGPSKSLDEHIRNRLPAASNELDDQCGRVSEVLFKQAAVLKVSDINLHPDCEVIAELLKNKIAEVDKKAAKCNGEIIWGKTGPRFGNKPDSASDARNVQRRRSGPMRFLAYRRYRRKGILSVSGKKGGKRLRPSGPGALNGRRAPVPPSRPPPQEPAIQQGDKVFDDDVKLDCLNVDPATGELVHEGDMKSLEVLMNAFGKNLPDGQSPTDDLAQRLTVAKMDLNIEHEPFKYETHIVDKQAYVQRPSLKVSYSSRGAYIASGDSGSPIVIPADADLLRTDLEISPKRKRFGEEAELELFRKNCRRKTKAFLQTCGVSENDRGLLMEESSQSVSAGIGSNCKVVLLGMNFGSSTPRDSEDKGTNEFELFSPQRGWICQAMLHLSNGQYGCDPDRWPDRVGTPPDGADMDDSDSGSGGSDEELEEPEFFPSKPPVGKPAPVGQARVL
jgi:hypothetical protein